jgi:hypothetical protein
VVGCETRFGLEGAIECEVDGRDSKGARCLGRGGSGGGVPSREMKDRALVEGWRERLCITLMVGLPKSCCSVVFILDTEDMLGGALSGAAPVGSRFPVSSIEAAMRAEHGRWGQDGRYEGGVHMSDCGAIKLWQKGLGDSEVCL